MELRDLCLRRRRFSSKKREAREYLLSRVHCVERSESRTRLFSKVLRNGIFASKVPLIDDSVVARDVEHAKRGNLGGVKT